MSLLLDALKKSEAQRRRGTSPTIDLTRTPPSASPSRSGSRWLPIVLAGVLLVAAAPWLWPHVSEWMESRQDGAGDVGAVAEAADTAAATDGPVTASGADSPVEGPAEQAAPAAVAGASSPRRVAAADASPAVVSESVEGGDEAPERSGEDSETLSSSRPDGDTNPSTAASSPDAGPSMQELRRRVQQQQQQQPAPASDASEPQAAPSEPKAEPARRVVNEPSENFIRPWELPQAQRAEFPELRLTVHFYAERAADRFVLINGERYREGQRVGPGTTLVEIRQRGAVVDFGSYRVLIE